MSDQRTDHRMVTLFPGAHKIDGFARPPGIFRMGQPGNEINYLCKLILMLNSKGVSVRGQRCLIAKERQIYF
jgi:hypothetical protein